MHILPDILGPNLKVVFCGTAVGEKSARRGHYYAGPGNKFWQYLHASKLTPALLRPEDDVTLPQSLALRIVARSRAPKVVPLCVSENAPIDSILHSAGTSWRNLGQVGR